MGDTAVLRRIPGNPEMGMSPDFRYGEGRKGTDLEYWSGELPLRLIGYLKRVNAWDLRGLSGLVIRHPEVRELADAARMLHQIIQLGSKRAREGRWRFGEAHDSMESIRRSIRRLHREIQEVAKKGRIFINSDSNWRNPGPRHA